MPHLYVCFAHDIHLSNVTKTILDDNLFDQCFGFNMLDKIMTIITVTNLSVRSSILYTKKENQLIDLVLLNSSSLL